MKNNFIYRAVFLALIMCLSLATVCFASQVTATGQGSTERNALHDAMRQAIEQSVGVMIDSRTYVENYQVISDKIYSQSEGYIQSYEVLNQNYFNGLYSVTIKAEVREQQLNFDLMSRLQKKAIIGANMQDPRIGVAAVDSDNNNYDVVENVIISGLQANGFSRIIDLNQIEESVRRRIASTDFQNDAALSSMLRNQFNVDYMVLAKIGFDSSNDLAEQGGAILSSMGLGELGGIIGAVIEHNRKVSATIGVRMYNTNTGEIIYAGSFSGKSSHSGNAVNDALSKAAQGIVPALAQSALSKAANPEQHVTVIVSGGALGSLSQAYNRISSLPGVSHVFTRSTMGGNIQMDVDYYGTAADLASEMEANGIYIREMTSEYIKI